MTEDFRQRLDRLEEFANRIQDVGIGWIYDQATENLRYNSICFAVCDPQCGEYIAAANPAMIREMIAKLRMLEKENERLKIELQTWTALAGKRRRMNRWLLS